jgi:DNA processing protein
MPAPDVSDLMPDERLDLAVGDRRDELVATVALSYARIATDERLATFISLVGSAVEVARLVEGGELSFESGEQVGLGYPLGPALERARDDVADWETRGYDVRTVLDPTYPENLQAIFNKPPLVFVLGTWDERRDQNAIAVVGTRKASDHGLRQAAKLSRELAEAKFTIISGLALGVDAAAHKAALQHGGRTVAVMGTGIDLRYPRGNAGLADAIVESGGALISQFFPSDKPLGWHFPKRNIVMSGLSLATVVIEASETSGAKMQARAALQHGRSVFLLQSLVDSHAWARRYVDDGVYGSKAIPISSTTDLLREFSATPIRRLRIAV